MKLMTPARLLTLSLSALYCSSAFAGVLEQSVGKWIANIEVQQARMRSGLELFMRADGSPNGNVLMLDRGFQSARLRQIVEQGDRLELDGPNQSHWSLQLQNGELVGEMKQNGASVPVRFQKTDSFGEPLRAQTPRGVPPYISEDIVFTSADGTKLSASLTRPKRPNKPAGKVNAVVLIHGTGPEDRDQTEDGHKNFAVLADYLTRQGMMVLRYDKRGVMRSAGNFEQHTLDQLLQDAQAAVQFLRSLPNSAKVGVLGHSEGAELAARVAAQATPAVDFVVSLSGPGGELTPVLLEENRRALAFAGATEEEQGLVMQVGQQFYPIVKTQADLKARMTALGNLMQSLSPEQKKVLGKYRAQLPTLSREIAASTWAYSALNTDPAKDWRLVRVPSLVLHGEKDTQIDASTNTAAIAAAFKESGNQRLELAILPSLNHNLQTATTGAQTEYSQIAETMAPQVLARVSRFILQQ